MPTPKEGESEKDFVSRCIPIVMNEGTADDNSQAAAICHSMYGKKKEAILRRTQTVPIRKAEGGRYRARAVRFGSPEELDWYGTYFDKDTKYHLDWYEERPWLYNHAMNPYMGTMRIGTWTDVEVNDEGVFFVGELLDHFKYKDAVEKLLAEEVLYPSSGTLSYVMDMDWETGRMLEWPIVELSSTVRPAEFRMEPIRPAVAAAIRALEGGMSMSEETPGAQDEFQETPQEEAPEDATPGAEVEDQDQEEANPAPEPAAMPAMTLEDLQQALYQELGLGELKQAIVMLDTRLHEIGEELAHLRSSHNELAKSKIEQVKAALADRKGWLNELFVASRDAEPDPQDAGDSPGTGRRMSQESVMAQGGPAAIIRQQQNL